MEWSTFFASLFSSLGGAIGISLIILRFAKKRTETYIDNTIQHRFDKKLEDYKQKLSKQFSNYETFSKKYYEDIEKIVSQFGEIEKHLKITQKGINKCIDEDLTLDYIFNQDDYNNSFIEFSEIVESLTQVIISCRICLPDHLTEGLENILNIIKKYITTLNQEREEVHLDRTKCKQLLNYGEIIYNKIEALSKSIREESLKLSGEL